MKKIIFAFLLVIFFFVFSSPLCADIAEQIVGDMCGVDEIEKNAPDGTENIKYDNSSEYVNEKYIFGIIEKAFVDVFTKNKYILLMFIVCAVLVSVLIKLSPEEATYGIKKTIGYAAVISCATLMFSMVQTSAVSISEICDSLGGFITSVTSVMTAAVSAAGYPDSAAGAYAVFSLEMSVYTYIISSLIIPCINIYLALGIAGSLTGNINLKGISSFFRKIAVGSLIFISCLFSGVLSLKISSAQAADTLFRRAARLSVSSFVPVIGSQVSLGLDSVFSCASAVKHSAGTYGMIAILVIVLPPVITALLNYITAAAGEAVFGLSECSEAKTFFTVSKDALSIVFAAAAAYVFAAFSGIGMIMGIGQ